MKRKDIERILKQGSVRQKIKLYMTDIALVNVDLDNIDYEVRDEELNIKGTKLLSERERDMLWSSIKDPKDIKYYNEIKTWNQSFLWFKDKFSIDLMKLQGLFYVIAGLEEAETVEALRRDLVNEILDLIPDEKTREKALNKAIEYGGKESQKKGYPKYLDIDRSLYWTELKIPTEMAIETAKSCKGYVAMFKILLANKLPLKPYRDWVKAKEKHLERLITNIYKITILEDTPPDFPKIESYEEIGTKITDEDIEDFKNAGV